MPLVELSTRYIQKTIYVIMNNERTKSIKIRLADYLSLEQMRIELIKQNGIVRSKLDILHLLLEAAKKEMAK